ncbi:hypothetical protein [Kribbella sp. NPDC003557]|uniref:hypothetical protein n=1 Tax=Kribbella sp. NPDC003557 TaxID=3154449 RepID=UPI0033B27F03
MRRAVAIALLALLILSGCGNPDQKLRSAAAQSAREAASEVNTTRLAVEQLRANHLWKQPAGQIVKDAEKGVESAASSFTAQQPSTETSTRLYEQVTKTLDDATTAVTAVRIALGNDDLAAAEQQLPALRRSSADLGRIGELTQ